MWKVPILALLALGVALPPATALLGTEDLPELPDAANDVESNAAYQGPTEFLDLTAAWIEYDNRTDDVIFTIRVTSAEELQNAGIGHQVGCRFEGDLTGDGEPRGQFSVTWVQPENRSYIAHEAMWTQETSPGTFQGRAVNHTFSLDRGTPGYFEFRIPRLELLQLSDQFENPRGSCLAWISCTAPPVYAFGCINNAGDPAESKAVYSFVELRQARTAEGENRPDELLPRNRTSPTASEPPETDTPTSGAIAVVLTVVIAVIAIKFRSGVG